MESVTKPRVFGPTRGSRTNQVNKVTLIPRGQAKGLTWFTPGEDQSLISAAMLKAPDLNFLTEIFTRQQTTGIFWDDFFWFKNSYVFTERNLGGFRVDVVTP